VAALPVVFEGREARLVSFHDITERHEAQARLRAIFESSPLAISTWDPQARPMSWNPAQARLFGWPSVPEEGPAVLDAEQERIVGGLRETILREGRLEQDVAMPGAAGKPLQLHAMAAPLRDPAGELVGFVGMAEDVTAAHATAQALRRSEAMAAVGKLIAGVAQEVRGPLFAIGSSLDALDAQRGEGWARMDLIVALRAELDRLGTLMRDLLDYGTPPATSLTRGQLGPAIAGALRACAPMAARAGVSLLDEASAQEVLLDLDGPRLAQVFQNLVQNAVQHSPSGSAVRVEARPAQVRGRPAVEVRVGDSGRGFLEQDLPHVFEPFFTRRKGGTGLGLSIVQRLVELHGGEVHAANAPEGGAVLSVLLPVARPIGAQ
jgi:PAS domain S-box-containing protein